VVEDCYLHRKSCLVYAVDRIRHLVEHSPILLDLEVLDVGVGYRLGPFLLLELRISVESAQVVVGPVLAVVGLVMGGYRSWGVERRVVACL